MNGSESQSASHGFRRSTKSPPPRSEDFPLGCRLPEDGDQAKTNDDAPHAASHAEQSVSERNVCQGLGEQDRLQGDDKACMSERPAGGASEEASSAGSEKDHLETEPAALLRRELTRWKFENHEVIEPQLVGLLADSGRFDDETAVALARRARQAYPLLDIWLAKALAGRGSQAMRRILVILSEIAQSNRILAPLTPVLRTKDVVVRSKAALLFARFCENPSFAEQFRKAGIAGSWRTRSRVSGVRARQGRER